MEHAFTPERRITPRRSERVGPVSADVRHGNATRSRRCGMRGHRGGLNCIGVRWAQRNAVWFIVNPASTIRRCRSSLMFRGHQTLPRRIACCCVRQGGPTGAPTSNCSAPMWFGGTSAELSTEMKWRRAWPQRRGVDRACSPSSPQVH